MLDFIERIFNSIEPGIAYLVLFASAFIENVMPPIPGDTVVVLGAYLVSTGKLEFWPVYITTCTGGLLGFMVMFFIGAKFGRTFFYKKARAKVFNINKLETVEKWFAKWGYWVIFANRFLSGTRSVISVFAGLFHLKWHIVMILGLFSLLIWNGLLIFAGILIGDNWEQILNYVSNYNKVLIGLTVIAIAAYLIRRKKKKEVKSE